jgi:hypothetical protein
MPFDRVRDIMNSPLYKVFKMLQTLDVIDNFSIGTGRIEISFIKGENPRVL